MGPPLLGLGPSPLGLSPSLLGVGPSPLGSGGLLNSPRFPFRTAHRLPLSSSEVEIEFVLQAVMTVGWIGLGLTNDVSISMNNADAWVTFPTGGVYQTYDMKPNGRVVRPSPWVAAGSALASAPSLIAWPNRAPALNRRRRWTHRSAARTTCTT